VTAPQPEPRPRRADLALLVVFLALLWIPLLDTFLQFDPAPAPNEKRALAAFPKFQPTLPGCREYLIGLEKYFNDHFGLRKTLLRWERKWKRSLFRESSVTEVMLGRDGWLYLARGSMVDNMLGNLSDSESRLQEWRQLFQARHDWCAQRGIAYVFVIAPEKHSVYPEYLPAWISAAGKPDQIGQLVAYLKTNSTVPVLDLRGPLIQAKATARTFHITDSHWNDYGAFVAYQSLIETLSLQKPELQPLPLSAFEQRRAPQPGGDLAVMLGQERTLIEPDAVTFEPLPPLSALETKPDASLALSRPRKASDPAILVAENPAARGKAVLFRDSFATAWQPFLAPHFNRTIYVWQHDWDIAFLEAQKPDVVIDEIVERSLYRGEPAKWKNP
jgi:hypothetical protein